MNEIAAMWVLGVKLGDDYKKAYLRAAKLAHPDKGGSEAAFILVKAAYEVLCKPHIIVPKSAPKGRWRESVFQSWFQKRLKFEGAFVFNVHGHAEQMAGIPDLYVCHPLFRGWLELKVRGNKLTPSQRNVMTQMRLKGDVAITVRLREDAKVEMDFDPLNIESEQIHEFRLQESYICQLNQMVSSYNTREATT